MKDLELVQYLSKFIARLDQEHDYYALKIRQLLDAYQALVVAEMTVEAILEDVNSGAIQCAV